MNRGVRGLMLSLAVASVGCGSSPPAQSSDLLAGFSPTAPTAAQIQVVTPIIHGITAGQDVTYCSYLDFTAPKTMDVTSYLGFQSVGGHHTILYAARQSQAPGTHECTDADMLNVKYIGGGGTDATIAASKIPPGIVFRIPEGAQLMMVSHWINTTGHTIDGQAAYDLDVQDPSPSVQPGDLFTTLSTNFSLPVGAAGVHTECTLKQDLQFFVVGGHAHEYATHITINHTPVGQTVSQVVYDTKWAPNLIFDTPLDSYTREAPLTMKAGDTFGVDCTYDNTTAKPISFPTEMCVGFGYYFPAAQEIDCSDGVWSGP